MLVLYLKAKEQQALMAPRIGTGSQAERLPSVKFAKLENLALLGIQWLRRAAFESVKEGWE